jgi:hypothetical protein
MTIKTYAAIFCAAAIALSSLAAAPAEAQTPKKSAAKKVAVPIRGTGASAADLSRALIRP